MILLIRGTRGVNSRARRRGKWGVRVDNGHRISMEDDEAALFWRGRAGTLHNSVNVLDATEV